MHKKVVIPLHGIRTHAGWQRAFVTVTQHRIYNDIFYCPLDGWSFGYFWLHNLLMSSQREKKIQWFRNQYHNLMHSSDAQFHAGDYPAIVAHSFGTYIVGHALIKYEYIKLDRIILCGSILPLSFPWKMLINRGQVREVRNEYGANDIWVRFPGWFIRDAGSSGYNGFDTQDDKLIQKQFLYTHSEYFEKGHMEHFWIPFLLGTPDPTPSAQSPNPHVPESSGEERGPTFPLREPTVQIEGPASAALGKKSYYTIISKDATRGEWSVGGFQNERVVVDPLGPSHEIYIEPTDKTRVGETFTIVFDAYNRNQKSARATRQFTVTRDGQDRIPDRATLAAEAETALNNPDTPYVDKKIWSARISRTVGENPLYKDLVLVASRYDSEVEFDLDRAIKE